jgi:hypothetical protein
MQTFSYDSKTIKLHICPELLRFIRREKYGPVFIISKEGYIFLTNPRDFENDKQKFIDTVLPNRPGRCNSHSTFIPKIMRGTQFDAICKKGWLFDSYTYIKGSLKYHPANQ